MKSVSTIWYQLSLYRLYAHIRNKLTKIVLTERWKQDNAITNGRVQMWPSCSWSWYHSLPSVNHPYQATYKFIESTYSSFGIMHACILIVLCLLNKAYMPVIKIYEFLKYGIWVLQTCNYNQISCIYKVSFLFLLLLLSYCSDKEDKVPQQFMFNG